MSLKASSPDAEEQCYLARSNEGRYWHRLPETSVNLAALSAVRGCPLRGAFHKLMRLHLLAAYHRKSREVDRVETAIVGFRGNKSQSPYRMPDHLRPLGHTVIEAWNSVLDGVPKVRHVEAEEIMAALRKVGSREAQSLVGYLGERYGL